MNEIRDGEELYVHVKETTAAGQVGNQPLAWSTDQPQAFTVRPDADGQGCVANYVDGAYDEPAHLIGTIYEGTPDELMVSADMIHPSGKVTIVDLDDVEVRPVTTSGQ